MNIVQVGYGYWGPNISRNIGSIPTMNLHAVCDMNPDRLGSAKGQLGDGPIYTTDYEQYLTDPNVDAFALAIQTDASFDIAKKIMNAGKHLFIEKPMASTAKKAEELFALAMEKGVVLHCDHIMVYHPIIRYIKQLIDSGELGELMYIDVSRMNLGPIRMDVNAMLDLAVHDLAVIDYLSGGAEAIKVDAMGEKRYGNQETLTYLTIRYEGFIAHVKSSWISPIKERRTMIGGTKKMAIFDDMRFMDKLSIYDHGIIHRDTSRGYGLYEYEARSGDILIPYIPNEDSLRNSLMHFHECIEEGKQSLSDGKQAIKVLKVLDMARERLNGKIEEA